MTDAATIAAQPFDVCQCGDFRHEHANGTGRCRVGACVFPSQCDRFRLSHAQDEYARRHPDHFEKVRAHLEKEQGK